MNWFLPGLLSCVIGQAVLLGPLSVWDIRPDLFLLLVFMVSQRCTPEAATVLGFLTGLCQDGLSGGPLGLHAFTDSLLGFTAARLSHHLYTDKPRALFWILLGGSAAAGGITLALLTFFLGAQPILPALLRVIAPEAVYTAAVGLLILWWLPQLRAILIRPV
jgi:rod shape-determining protein MreD